MMKEMKGSFTVEAAVILPLVFMVFGVSLTLLFYYHDKNILASAAYETAVYGASNSEKSETELEQHFQSRIGGKLLLFSDAEGIITAEEELIQVVCHAKKKRMTVKAESVVKRTNPEKYIRKIRKGEKIQNGIGGTQ